MSWETKYAQDLQLVWQRIVSGDRIRFYCDFYGGHWIELTPRWQFWRKRTVRLAAADMFQIRTALSEGRRIGSRRDNAVA